MNKISKSMPEYIYFDVPLLMYINMGRCVITAIVTFLHVGVSLFKLCFSSSFISFCCLFYFIFFIYISRLLRLLVLPSLKESEFHLLLLLLLLTVFI